MKNLLPLLILVSFAAISCSKENTHTGIVKDYGSVALDGCGWVIEVNDEVFKPTNLDSQFHKDNLTIIFNFKELNSKTNCGLEPDAMAEIEILDIE